MYSNTPTYKETNVVNAKWMKKRREEKKLEYKWHPKGKKEKRGRYKCNECGECVYKFCW